jgi:hypothetical protein
MLFSAELNSITAEAAFFIVMALGSGSRPQSVQADSEKAIAIINARRAFI